MATVTVGPVGRDYTSVNAAINDGRVAGDVIVCDSGVTFTEDITLPTTQHATPVIIKSSTAAPDRRVGLSDAANMATIVAASTDEPGVYGSGVKGWEFEFIRFYRNSYAVNPCIYLLNENLGGGSFRNTQNITFDRCLIEGGTSGSWGNGIYAHGANITVDRSYISNIRYAGRESHGFVSHDGPGPFTITDNFIEAASINILFGGWTSSSTAHTPNNILVENNYCFKRLSWLGAGFGVKNLFELKHATNVTVRGNTFENNWTDGQDGHGILFQATNDAGDSPWTKITDVQFENNVIRNTERGINLNGYDYSAGHESSGMYRITFFNNFFQIDTSRILTVVNEVHQLTINHNTFVNADSDGKFAIMIYGLIAIPGGPPHTRGANYAIQDYIFNNNLLYHAAGHEGEYGLMGTAGLDEHVDGSYEMTHNVMAGGPDGITYPGANIFPSVTVYETNFVDLTDYVLTPGSDYKNAGNDGEDIGRILTGGSPSVSPSASLSPSASVSRSPSASVSPSVSRSPSPSASVSPSSSPSRSASRSPSPSSSPSRSPSPSASPSSSLSPSSSVSSSVSPSPSASLDYVFTIAGFQRNFRSKTLRISETANGRNTLSCQLVSATGSYRPNVDDEVIFTEAGVRIFGGLIESTAEDSLYPQGGTPLVNSISCVDFNAYADRVFFTHVTSGDTPLKEWLEFLVNTTLTNFGVTVHPSQATGPNIPAVSYTNRLIRDILDEFSTLTGWIWDIDYNKRLFMWAPGSRTCPFNVIPESDDHAIADVVQESSRPNFANRVIVEFGQGVQSRTQTFVGNSSNRVFALDMPIAGFPNPVTVSGSYVHVAPYVGDGTDLFEWTYRASDNSIVQLAEAPTGVAHAALTSAQTLSVTYPAQYPGVVYSPTSQPSNLREKRIAAPDVFDPNIAQDLADSLVARYSITYKRVKYRTFETGVVPGMHQNITVMRRGVVGTHLVTDVESQDVETTNSTHRILRTVSAVAGTTYPGSWREEFRQLTGGGGSGSSSVLTLSGVPLVQQSGMFDGNVFAGNNGDGTNLIYESSMQFLSKSTLGGPGVQLGRLTDSNTWNVFADFIRNGGGVLQQGLVINPISETQGAVHFRVYDTNKVVLAAVNSATSFVLGAPTTLGLGAGYSNWITYIYTDDIHAFNGVFERGRTARMGEFTSVAYSNSTYLGDFVDADWDVASSGVQVTYKFIQVGNSVTVHFAIGPSSVTAGVAALQISIPFTISGNHYNVGWAINAGNAAEPLVIRAENGNTYLGLWRLDGTWGASTNQTYVWGQIQFEKT